MVVSAILRWNARGYFLLATYAVIFAALFLSNNASIAQKFLAWLFLPAALFMWGRIAIRPQPPHFRLSISVETTITFSIIFVAALIYLLALNISSTLQPDLNKRLADQQWLYAAEILLVMIVTAHAMVRIEGFLIRLIAVTVPIVALSACINIWAFLSNLPLDSIAAVRLVNWLGMPAYTNSTNISLTYALFLVAAVALIVRPASYFLLRWWLALPAVILLIGVVLTQSRSAYFGTALGVGLVVILEHDAAFWRRNAVKATAGLAVAAALVFSIPTVRMVVTERGESLRPAIWTIYLERAKAKPLIGYGSLSNIDITLADGTVIDQPHNLILSAQIRGGLFAMFAMLTILGGSLYWSARHWAHSRDAVPLAMITTIVATGMFDYNLLITAPTWPWVTFWLPFGICAGAEIAVRSTAVLKSPSAIGHPPPA